MKNSQYTFPVNQLLKLGGIPLRKNKTWINYLEFGLSDKDVPELIQMALDEHIMFSADEVECYSNIHAWRALGQLKSIEAVDPLIKILYTIDDEDYDWLSEDFSIVMEMIGKTALPKLAEYLNNGYGTFAVISVADSIRKIGLSNPEVKDECITLLDNKLKNFNKTDPTINAFIIDYLTTLNAVNTLDTIRLAYKADAVDISILGDVEDAEIQLGLLKERKTPPPEYAWVLDDGSELKNRHFLDDDDLLEPNKKKVGRNDPCICGSGKKYKKCCLRL